MKGSIKYYRDRVILGVYSNKSPDEFKSYLLELFKSSKNLTDDSRSYQKSIYFVSKELNSFMFPPRPHYSIRVKFKTAKNEDNLIANILVRGNTVYSLLKYFVIVFAFCFIILNYNLFNKSLFSSALLMICPSIFSLILHFINISNIKVAAKETSELLSSKSYEIKIID